MRPEFPAPGGDWYSSAPSPPEAAAQRWESRRQQFIACMAAVSIGSTLLAAGWMAGRSPPESFPPQVVPGEFERQDAILVAWTDRVLPQLQVPHQDAVAAIVAAARENIDIIVLVPDEHNFNVASRRLRPPGTPANRVRFLQLHNTLIWVRDYSPLSTKSFDGSFPGVYSSYQRQSFPGQDEIPLSIGRAIGLPLLKAPIVAQNGNLLSNGMGLCVTSDKLLKDNEGMSEKQLAAHLRNFLGATQVVFLESLIGEPTGHVDMFATFTAPDSVVVGQYATAYDPRNAAILDRNADRLARVRTAAGPLRVHRIPMPQRQGDVWPTYTNVLYANGILLVPSFGASQCDSAQRAMSMYRNLLPGWKIVCIDCSELIRGHGALHCVAMNLYKVPQSLQ